MDNVFIICMALKTLRIFHLSEIVTFLEHVKDFLCDIFITQRILLSNLLNWFKASLKLIMAMHYFACIWVLIAKLKESAG